MENVNYYLMSILIQVLRLLLDVSVGISFTKHLIS